MKSDTVTRRIFFCVFVFWFLSLFSSFTMAAENIPEAIWNLEQKRNQEKTRAEFIGAKIDEGEYNETIETELVRIEEKIQGYNLQITQLQERQVKEQERVKQTAIISSTREAAYEKQDADGGSWFGKLVLFAIVGGVAFFLYGNWESLTRKPENVTPSVFNQRFDTIHRTSHYNASASQEPLSPPKQQSQEDIQVILNRGIERLNNRPRRLSRAPQNGEVPPDLV